MPAIWIAVAIIAIAVVLLLPLPTPPNANKPAGLDDFTFPTADPGRSIPELYGTLWVFGNLIWYGALTSKTMRACA